MEDRVRESAGAAGQPLVSDFSDCPITALQGSVNHKSVD